MRQTGIATSFWLIAGCVAPHADSDTDHTGHTGDSTPMTVVGVAVPPADPPAAARQAPPDFAQRHPGAKPVQRTANSTTWQRPDGRQVTVIHPGPVNHRAADGTWQPIDPTLRATETGFENTSGPLVARWGRTGADPLSIEVDGSVLRWKADFASPVLGRAEGPRLHFDDVYPGVDEVWTMGAGVRHEWIVHGPHAQPVWSGLLTLPPDLSLNTDNPTLVIERAGEPVLYVPPPVAYEASDRSQRVVGSWQVRPSARGLELTTVIAATWLDDPHRSWPVVVDPDFLPTLSTGTLTDVGTGIDEVAGPLSVGLDTNPERGWAVFDLAGLTAGTVEAVWVNVDITTPGFNGSPPADRHNLLIYRLEDHPSSVDGSEPETRWVDTADGRDYQVDPAALQGSGATKIALNGTIERDVQRAASLDGWFGLGFSELGDNSAAAVVTGDGSANAPTLEVEVTPTPSSANSTTIYVNQSNSSTGPCNLARENDSNNAYGTIMGAYNCVVSRTQAGAMVGKGIWRIEILDSSTYDEELVFDGLTTDATNHLVLTATPGAWPTLTASGAGLPTFISDDYTVIENLRITQNSSVDPGCVQFLADYAVARHNVIYGCSSGVYFANAVGGEVAHNTIDMLAGTVNLDRGAVKLSNTTLVKVHHNIMRVTPAGDGSVRAAHYVPADSQNGFEAYQNLIWLDGTTEYANWGGTPITDIEQWWNMGQDNRSVVEPPMFVDRAAGDYHLKSPYGTWNGASYDAYPDELSPAIDAGDPRESIGNEPAPNGLRINLGAYGGTPEASLSEGPVVTALAKRGNRTTASAITNLTGRGLSGVTEIDLLGTKITNFAAQSDELIAFTIPSGLATGTADVVVSTPARSSLDSGVSFTSYVAGPPLVGAIEPHFGPDDRFTRIQVHGGNFNGTTSVTLDGQVLDNVRVVEDHLLTADVPAGLGFGSHDLIVTTGAGDSSGNTEAFTVTETHDLYVSDLVAGDPPCAEGSASMASPYKTLQAAFDCIGQLTGTPNDTTGTGRWTVHILDYGPYAGLTMNGLVTTEEDPVIVTGYDTVRPRIDEATTSVVRVDIDHVTLEGLEVTGATPSVQDAFNVLVTGDHVRIDDCKIWGANAAGRGFGITQWLTADDLEVFDSEIYGNDIGILLYAGTGRVHHNRIYSNTVTGVHIEDRTGNQRSVLDHNVFYDHPSAAVAATYQSVSVLRNNTLVSSGFALDAQANAWVRVHNSLFTNGTYGWSTALDSGTIDGNTNGFFGNSIDAQALDLDRNPLALDPRYLDGAAADFHLQSTAGAYDATTGTWDTAGGDSPYVDAGLVNDSYALEPAYNGERVNVGAYGNTAQASRTSVTHPANSLIFTELQVGPTADIPGEYIEIKNVGTQAVSLQGCVLTSVNDGHHVIDRPLVVQVDEIVLLGRDPTLANGLGFVVADYVYDTITLDTSDDLSLNCGTAQDSVSWSSWPTTAGASMSLDITSQDASSNDATTDPAVWCPSVTAYSGDVGTPGSANDLCTACPDADGDGFADDNCGGTDCDDADRMVFPGATEYCTGKLEDCNGSLPADEADGDFDTYTSCQGDCDDSVLNGDRKGSAESCGNSVDNDCDGIVDESELPWGAAQSITIVGNDTISANVGVTGTEVGDIDAIVNITHGRLEDLTLVLHAPGGTNITLAAAMHGNNLNDAVFDDEAFTATSQGSGDYRGAWIPDQPLSTFDGLDPTGTWTLDIINAGAVTGNFGGVTLRITETSADGDNDGWGCVDCDDTEPAAFPGNPEVCDSVDNDCNGQIDDGGVCACTDADNDGDCSIATGGTDCDDNNGSIYTGAPEVADNTIDEDCNGFDTVTCFEDLDNDGVGSTNPVLSDVGVCESGQSTLSTDCDDNDSAAYPGNTTLIVEDGIDNDCNGADECYIDNDSDGYGLFGIHVDDAGAPGCNEPGESSVTQDCDDSDADNFPGNFAPATIGNGTDNDCDGFDECYADGDQDGEGIGILAADSEGDGCNSSQGQSLSNEDCNDAEAEMFPGNLNLIVGDGLDNDCDGSLECYIDGDMDGLGSLAVANEIGGDGCNSSQAESTVSGDCDDSASSCADDCSDSDGDTAPDCRDLCTDIDGDDHGTDLTGTKIGNAAVSVDQCTIDGTTGCAMDAACIDADCVDTDQTIYNGAPETPDDGIDQDCSGGDTVTCYLDGDGDGHAGSTPQLAERQCDPGLDQYDTPTDCDDGASGVYPGNPSPIVADGFDQDCDGADECYLDADQDGHGVLTYIADSGAVGCTDPGESTRLLDCDDTDASVVPDNTDPAIVGNGVDNDCIPGDECFEDGDSDGVGTSTLIQDVALDGCLSGQGEATVDGDCDDTDAGVSPITAETVGDGADQNCDGVDDCYTDADQDGHGVAPVLTSTDLQCLAGRGQSPVNDDCDDGEAGAYPGNPEIAGDGIDNDCSGSDAANCFFDGDQDGHGSTSPVVADDGSCDTSQQEAADNLDCDDTDATIYGGATETPDNGVDEDCSGADSVTCFEDLDNDGYGSAISVISPTGACSAGYADVDTDCNDNNFAYHPGTTDVADNGVDEDCNGADTITCYQDLDGDGFGDRTVLARDGSCDANEDEVTNDQDCDDADADEFPNQEWYADCDGDGDSGSTKVTACSREDADLQLNCGDNAPPDGGWALSDAGDCDDEDASVYPGAAEVPDNAIDEDCDGFAAITCFIDQDRDGFGQAGTTTAPDGSCDAADGESNVSGDCDDTDDTVNPDAEEVAGDGIDNDCDGVERVACFVDADGDGFGDPNAQTEADSCDGAGVTDDNTDCDDSLDSAYPGAEEVWYDGIDQDCDGRDDDQDNDGTPLAGDCNDEDPDIGPHAIDRPDDGIDQDCSGHDLKQSYGSGLAMGGCGCDTATPNIGWLWVVLFAMGRRRAA